MKLKLTIDRLEDKQAVLKTEDNQTINWPIDKLPVEAHEGSTIIFNILTDQESEKDKREQAKDMLNEILDVDDNTDKSK